MTLCAVYMRLSMSAAYCLQDLLDNPNPQSPAQAEPYMLYCQNREEYNRRVKNQAIQMRPKD